VGPVIPDDNNLARYCKPKTIDEDGNVTYAAFLLRRNADGTLKENYLSVFWLEKFNCATLPDALIALIAACRTGESLKLAATGRLALLHVGRTRDLVRQRTADSRMLPVTHEDPPYFHAGVYETTPDDDNVAAAILESAINFAPTS
jgi:hypothetical protein